MAMRTKKLTRAARRAVKKVGKTAAKVARGTGKIMTRIRKEATRRHLRSRVVVAGAVTAAAADELR